MLKGKYSIKYVGNMASMRFYSAFFAEFYLPMMKKGIKLAYTIQPNVKEGVMLFLRHVRESRGLSQSDLAIMAGVSQPCISILERGSTRNPKLSTLIRLGKVLECDPGLLTRKVEEVGDDERELV